MIEKLMDIFSEYVARYMIEADQYDDFGIYKTVARMTNLQPGKQQRNLDIGCGPGYTLRSILEEVHDAFLLGIDINPSFFDCGCFSVKEIKGRGIKIEQDGSFHIDYPELDKEILSETNIVLAQANIAHREKFEELFSDTQFDSVTCTFVHKGGIDLYAYEEIPEGANLGIQQHRSKSSDRYIIPHFDRTIAENTQWLYTNFLKPGGRLVVSDRTYISDSSKIGPHKPIQNKYWTEVDFQEDTITLEGMREGLVWNNGDNIDTRKVIIHTMAFERSDLPYEGPL
jgi:SAM-dependent methyltransferase